MNKEEIKKLYKDKIKKFRHNNLLYFEKSKPEISDEEFDNLKNEILLCKKNLCTRLQDIFFHVIGEIIPKVCKENCLLMVKMMAQEQARK